MSPRYAWTPILALASLLTTAACEPSWYDFRIYDQLADETWVETSEAPDGIGGVSYGTAIAAGGVSDNGASILVAAAEPDGFGHLVYDDRGALDARGIELFVLNSVADPNLWTDAPAMASDPDSPLVAVGMSNGGQPPTQATVVLLDSDTAQPAGTFSLPGPDLIRSLAFGQTNVAGSGAGNVVALRYEQLGIIADASDDGTSAIHSCSHGLSVPMAVAVGNLDPSDPEDEIVFAAANGANPSQVFILSGSTISDAAATVTPPDIAPCFDVGRDALAVLDGPMQETDFGAGIAIADFNGNGVPDLAIGSTDSGQVYVYRDVDLSGGQLPANPISVLGTADAIGFGAIVTAGDVYEQNGEDELIVAIPDARIDGMDGVGAVHIYDFGQGMFATPIVLHDSQPEADQQFGQSVAVVPFGQDRQILAVASGDEVYTYFRVHAQDADPRVGAAE